MTSILNTIAATDRNWGSFISRLTIAIVIFPHGCQLLSGMFGGMGYTATMQYFTEVAGLPYVIGMLVIFIQFFGSLFILLGALTRLVSAAMVILFIGMIITSHLEYGFFMNWFGTQKGEGYEYHLLVIGLASGLIASGGGKWSVDMLLAKQSFA